MRRVLTAVVLAAALTGCGGAPSDDPTGTAAGPTPTTSPSSDPQPSPTAACSADEVTSDLPDQPRLPEPVVELRQDIDAAAGACDYERLEALALAGDGAFTASFGGAGAPAAFWRQEEAAGREPLRMLRLVLRLQHAASGDQVVWPAAFVRDSWDEVTAEEREELRSLHDERDMRSFAQFGAYAGHRVVVTADGDWQAFVAGD